MKIEKKEVTITKEEYYFVAEDGTEFESERACKEYELHSKQTEIQHILDNARTIYDVIQESVYLEDIQDFYYISNEIEMQNVWGYLALIHGINPPIHANYYYEKEGWYVRTYIDDVYNGDDGYYDLIRVDFKAWHEWLAQLDWIREEGVK